MLNDRSEISPTYYGGTGIEHRYDVTKRNDPTGKHKECGYFVLDPQHDVFARRALRAYAAAVRDHFPVLSNDIIRWVDSIEQENEDKRTPRGKLQG
jgi:hypothetical protein